MNNTTFDRWIWIELIGFDHAKADFGVEAFLANAGFVPDAASLLLFNADFVHTHEGMQEDRTLQYDVCSYCGHPYSAERNRQDWTKFQLRGLVRELQKHGIAVYFSVFDMFMTQEWIGNHTEILHVRRTGETIPSVCPWKRLADNTYYEDFFAERLAQVMKDYGFDGFHGADGYSHPRIPIYDGDFSDDMVDQFLKATGVELPSGIAASCDGAPELIEARADWIWRNKRREWIDFYAKRTQTFWRKMVRVLHAEKKQVVVNSCWTRDPFEAKYRYGMDAKLLTDIGVDGFIVEAASAASETEREASSARVLYDFMAMFLLNKAYVPQAKMWYLHGVKDTMEQWNVLRHAPTSLEREVYSLSNLFVRESQGAWMRCADGLVVCLADGIERHEWQWLRDIWNLAFSGTPQRSIGATLVWSEAALANQSEDFITTRRCTTHALLHRLIAAGAPVCSAVNVTDLAMQTGTLLVLNAHLFPEHELRQILAYRNGPVVMIGGPSSALPEPDYQFADGPSAMALSCQVYGAPQTPAVSFETLSEAAEAKVPADLMTISDPRSFLDDLFMRDVSEGFLKSCSEVLLRSARGIRILRGQGKIYVSAMEMETGKLRLFIGNDGHGYTLAQLDLGETISKVDVLTQYPGMPIVFEGSRFHVKVPGRGMVVLEVTPADSD